MRELTIDNKLYVEMTGTVLGESDEAVRADMGQTRPTWIPKSQMEDRPDVGDTGDLLITLWIAEEKGLI